ncbi:hypothetical protein P5673_014751 [Acropora cervicornis]|uniref:Uncharacterized protein n=1 Tax=Acropora cervicornis TaxID=6130 RepID=A0AAD9QIQ6_ACRCE|nr:hypothetical protein P5673_014751 [Acropora cervicornis]
MKNIIPEKSGDYQPKIQALQRDEGRRERKERGNLQLLSRKPEAAKEEKQLQRKATRPERKFSQQISKVTCEKGKKKKKKKKRTTTQKVRCCRKEFVAADTEAKIDFLPQVEQDETRQKENFKEDDEQSNAEKSKCDALSEEVRRLKEISGHVRHYAERENQSWEKEIQEWKTKSEKYEQENQALQKSLGSAMEKQERLEVLSTKYPALPGPSSEKRHPLP